MGEQLLADIRTGYRRVHSSLLDVARSTAPDVFDRPLSRANSIAFNFWHVARWDDSLFPSIAHAVPELGERLGAPTELWVRERIGERWNMPPELGGGSAGTGLPTDAAQGLVLPGREELVAYAERVFDEFSERLDRVDEESLSRTVTGPRGDRTIGNWLLYYWEHASRHLGMMEALRGAFGEAGSARG